MSRQGQKLGRKGAFRLPPCPDRDISSVGHCRFGFYDKGFTRNITKMQFCGKDRIDETNRLCDVIGTHSARRTFVVHALEMGWSPQLVMTYTGHENYETMKPYIALTDKTRKKMMETNF